MTSKESISLYARKFFFMVFETISRVCGLFWFSSFVQSNKKLYSC